MRIDGVRARAAWNLPPLVGASLLAWASALVGSSIDWPLYALSACIALLSGVMATVEPPALLRGARQALPSLVFLAGVALLRSSAGGISSGVSIVALLPVFTTALNTTDRRQLAAVTLGVAAFFLLPILFVGPPTYPHSQYRAALLFTTISALIGLATQRLVGSVRAQASEARRREEILRDVTSVIKALDKSSREHARNELCSAAKAIGDASFAILYEATGGDRLLRSTAMSGLDIAPIEIAADKRSGAKGAFLSGRPLLFSQRSGADAMGRELWEIAGRPASILFEPLRRGSETIGVLVVGWPAEVEGGDYHTSVISLLAHEVSAVLERADLLSEVTRLASTDPLTGLPNRRAWNVHLEEAIDREGDLILAMLDLDHFKPFNDSYGHPAGDRLLKEAAARWRDELRAGNILARLGGDEFALLLPNSSISVGLTVVERLRGCVPAEQSCSAGLAQRLPGDSPETLLTRADAALYKAKAEGRARAHVEA